MRVILVGDSTLAPRTGYGNALCGHFRPEVHCVNLARGGRSTLSFRAEGLWNRVQELLAERQHVNYVLIQFGHNDQPGKPGRSTDLATEFPVNLERYVDEVRAAGGTPVLATPLTRRMFRDGVLDNNLAPWAEATRGVASARVVTLLDVNAESAVAVSRMGEREADTLAMAPPDFDRTHLGSKGAAYFARMVSRQLGRALPALAPLMAMRPQLNESQAAGYSYRAVLGSGPDGWDPLSDPFATRSVPAIDATVDPAAKADGERTFTTVQSAIDHAATRSGRVRILVKPGVYDELVYVPDTGAAVTLVGGGSNAGATRIRASLYSRTSGAHYAAAFGAAFAKSPPAIAAMHASVKERAEIGTAGSAVAWIRGHGFQARNITFENAFDRGEGDERGQHQAVALMVDGADQAHFDDVRFFGFQDTLYLRSPGDGRIPRVFIHRSKVHGDMDFIFGDATAYFLDSEIRTIGAFRRESFALAPSTHHATRFGFVFHRCSFTHDDSPNARAGVFKLARQWPQGQRTEAVGKAVILESRIGAHIDKVQPWASWNAPGTPRYRAVQYDSNDYLGYAAGPMPAEPYLAEFRNTHD